MADKAFYKLKNGIEIEIEANRVTKDMRKDEFLCSGCNGDCRAEVEPYWTVNGTFFRVKRNGRPHKFGCLNDKSEAARIVRSLDHMGINTTPEELYDRFSKFSSNTSKNGKEDEETSGCRNGNSNNNEELDAVKRIQCEPRDPSNLKELCSLLSKKDIDDIYAGVPVGSLFVDHRNIAGIRRNGLSEGKPVIMLLSMISIKRIEKLALKIPNQAIVLGDAYSYTDRATQLICIVPCTSNARKKIFEKKNGQKIIAIFGKWKKDPSNEGVYVCDPIEENHIFCADEKFYEC